MAGTIVLTGANGTLALEYVRHLLELYPDYTLLATVRNTGDEDPNTAKLRSTVRAYPKAKAWIEKLDLGQLADVRRFSGSLTARVNNHELPRVSAIVCNAATWSLEAGQKFTVDGFEATFQVNHLSHYLLVLKLLGAMDMTAGRVVMLSSITHYPEKKNPLSSFRPGFPDDMEELVHPQPDVAEETHDRGFQRYGTAKLSNVTFMNDLNARFQRDPDLTNLAAVAMDPGGLATSRAQAQQKRSVRRIFAIADFLMPLIKHITSAIRPVGDAAMDLVALSVDPAFRGARGHYTGRHQSADAEISRDSKAQIKLWEACWKWAGLSQGETILRKERS